MVAQQVLVLFVQVRILVIQHLQRKALRGKHSRGFLFLSVCLRAACVWCGLWPGSKTPQDMLERVTAMLVQQWFPVDTPWGQEDFNNPYARFTWRNSFSLPAGFRLDVDLDADTRGENESYRLGEGTCSLDVAVYKEFFDERLSIQLKGTDLFNSSRVPVTLYSGNRLMTIDQESRRRITLTLRYKFNAAKSKYKGTGAGQEQKNRM